MLHKIENYISRHHLPPAPAKLIVALSGGADSVALLLIMKKLGYEVVAAHCNFHLRGEESDRDEAFVRQLCVHENVTLEVRHFQTEQFSTDNNISIEMAARELRYEWFERLREKEKAIAIAVAHHSDDNAETLLLNLVRGSGIHGLKGMLPQNGHVIRPLLCVKRRELELFLKDRQQDYVTDSTNLETIYKRNKIRHIVLPELRQLNPAIDEILSQTAQRLAEAEGLFNMGVDCMRQQLCTSLSDGINIDIEGLQRQPAATTLLYEILSPHGFTPATISMIGQHLSGNTGTCFESKNYLAVIHRGFLQVRTRPASWEHPLDLPSSGCIEYGEHHTLSINRLPRKHLAEIPKVHNKVAIDADKIVGKLHIRPMAEGDRFHPYGMKGSKLVSDYLTDRHRSLIDKAKTFVIYDDKGIVWLVDERVDQRAAVTTTTDNILLLELRS